MIRRICAALFTVFVLSPHAALAQESGQTTAPRIPNRSTVFVLDNQGVEHRGKFVRFDGQELVLAVDDNELRFKRDVISRIERAGDPLKNGAIIGAVVGGSLGLLAALLQAENPGEGIAAVALNTGLYSAIGTGIDAAVQGRTVVYHVWPSAPVRAPAGPALAFTLRW